MAPDKRRGRTRHPRNKLIIRFLKTLAEVTQRFIFYFFERLSSFEVQCYNLEKTKRNIRENNKHLVSTPFTSNNNEQGYQKIQPSDNGKNDAEEAPQNEEKRKYEENTGIRLDILVATQLLKQYKQCNLKGTLIVNRAYMILYMLTQYIIYRKNEVMPQRNWLGRLGTSIHNMRRFL